jgi:hypothetical protein
MTEQRKGLPFSRDPADYAPRCQSCHIIYDRAKLTEAQALEIFRLAQAGSLSQRAIGKRFGVSNAVVFAIKTGKAWAHVTRSARVVGGMRWVIRPTWSVMWWRSGLTAFFPYDAAAWREVKYASP